jgi:hypothetical protein
VPSWEHVKPYLTAASVLTLRSTFIMSVFMMMTSRAAALGTLNVATHQVRYHPPLLFVYFHRSPLEERRRRRPSDRWSMAKDAKDATLVSSKKESAHVRVV